MNIFGKNNSIITGAFILTCSGFMCRILGFFYKIFLSRNIGAEGLGIYHMIFPIYGICLSLCTGAIQTSISKLVAADSRHARNILRAGFGLSLTISLILCITVYSFSGQIAVHILREPRCSVLLPCVALSVPCCAIHSCICGYYYGRQKVSVPSLAQFLEQIVRIASVFLISCICHARGIKITVFLAVLGLLIGEAASSVFCVLVFVLSEHKSHDISDSNDHSILFSLISLALPLTMNRVAVTVLQSIEAILIPGRLMLFGMTSSMAYSTYGILTGMALPFILFPSAITVSAAVILLPAVSRAKSSNDLAAISKAITVSIRYSMYMGIFCVFIFILFGSELGICVFNNSDAGTYIKILAWLCPFMYLSTALGSIITGLGRPGIIFRHHMAVLALRLLFVFCGISRIGIKAYLFGLLISEICLFTMHLFSLRKLSSYNFNPVSTIIKPIFFMFLSTGIYYSFFSIYTWDKKIPRLFAAGGEIIFICFCYVGLLFLFHAFENRHAA